MDPRIVGPRQRTASAALPKAAREAERAVWRATYARLPTATHPHSAASARHLVADMARSAYPAALDLLLDAAAARLAETRAPGTITGHTGQTS